MTSQRATSYRLVLKTLRDRGPAKLWPTEEDRIRQAADALLFCDEFSTDLEAGEAFASAAELTVDLVDAGRWTRDSALQLMSDIWGCGPGHARSAVAA